MGEEGVLHCGRATAVDGELNVSYVITLQSVQEAGERKWERPALGTGEGKKKNFRFESKPLGEGAKKGDSIQTETGGGEGGCDHVCFRRYGQMETC